MSLSTSKPRATLLEFSFLFAAGGIALSWGYLDVEAWTSAGLFPGARNASDFWPTWFVVHLGLLLLFSFKRPLSDARSNPVLGAAFERFASLALSLIAWALSIEFATEVAAVPSALEFGGGPILRPFVLLLGLALGWYAFGGPTLPGVKSRAFVFEHSLAERSLVLFTIFCTANGKLFLKSGSAGYSLILVSGLATAVLLAQGKGVRQLAASIGRALGKPAAFALFALPLWWWVAAVNAASPLNAIGLAWRLLVPALVAAVAIPTLSKDGIRRVFSALVFGFGCALFAGLLGIIEALGPSSVQEVLSSRLRILGLHPNLGAALLAIGLPLTMGWIQSAPEKDTLRRRLLGGSLFVSSVIALYLTGSRAGGLGAVLSVGGFLLLAFSSFGRRIHTKSLLGIAAACAIAFAIFLTPLGDGLRDTLDAKAQTQSAIGQRWHIWKMASDAALDHPLTGIGPVGFASHAQYAEPSYYDGTAQTLHTHNIFLAAVAGAGFPGLFLFVGWLVAFLGLGIRAMVAEGRANPALASVVAASIGLLICNLFDLGQSQLTFLPLFFWIALLLFGARARLAAGADTRSKQSHSFALPLLSLFALWPTAIGPLSGAYLVESAAKSTLAGDTALSSAQLELALLSSYLPSRSETRAQLARQYTKAGMTSLRLGTLELGVAESPYNSIAERRYASALLDVGEFQKGAKASARAFELDPRGEFIGTTRMLQAWAAFELGEIEAGSSFLIEGFANGAKPPKGMRFMRSLEDKKAVFQAKGDQYVPLDSILAKLGENLVEMAKVDQVRARRELTGLIEAYKFNRDPGEAAPWIRRVIEASENPIRATFYQMIEVLLNAGEEEQARGVWESMDLGDDTNLADVFSDLFSDEDDVSDRQLAVSGLDIFFSAGQLRDLHLDWAIRLSSEGKRDLATHEIERAIYDSASSLRRTRMAYDFLCQGASTKEQRVEDLVRFLKHSAFSRKDSGDIERFRMVFGVLNAAFEGDLDTLQLQVRHAVEGVDLGSAGVNFLNVLSEEVAKNKTMAGE